jgi:Family of unknown function (DUF5519)
MAIDRGDALWEKFVQAALGAGPAEERRSRYAEKPALFVAGREIAHCEAAGVIDLRITRGGWQRADEELRTDPAVHHTSTRRDWIELHVGTVADLDRLRPLIVLAVVANS